MSSSYVPVATTTDTVIGNGFTQVFPGSRYTCGLQQDGNIYCWGYNGYGPFGTGDTTEYPYPRTINVTLTPVTTTNAASYVLKSTTPGDYLDNVVSVDGSGYYVNNSNNPRYAGMCALLSTGKVRCWGSAANVIYGDGVTTTAIGATRGAAYRDVQDLANVTELRMSEGQISGQSHACALVSDGGKVKCW